MATTIDITDPIAVLDFFSGRLCDAMVKYATIWDMTLSLPKNEHTPADVLVSPTDLPGSPMWIDKVHCPLGHERLVVARACEQFNANPKSAELRLLASPISHMTCFAVRRK